MFSTKYNTTIILINIKLLQVMDYYLIELYTYTKQKITAKIFVEILNTFKSKSFYS